MLTKQLLRKRIEQLEARCLAEPVRVLCTLSDGSETIIYANELLKREDIIEWQRVVSGSSLKDVDLLIEFKLTKETII